MSDRTGLSQIFLNDGLLYTARIYANGEFSFDLIGGVSRKGPAYCPRKNRNNLFRDEPISDDVNLNESALPVYIKAGKIFTNWIYRTKPRRFGFSASTTRKINIYRWFAKKLSAQFPGYMCSEYPEGSWSFYRLV